MSQRHIKTIYKSGMQLWLSEKKSILLRLLIWPNLINLGLVALVALSILALQSKGSSGESLESASASGVNFTIYGGEYEKEISSVLSSKPLQYEYIETNAKDVSEIKDMISAKAFTFALSVESIDTSGSEQVTLNLIYDRKRGYIHKKWLAAVKNKSTAIAQAIRDKKILDNSKEIAIDTDTSPVVLNESLPKIKTNLASYAKASGPMSMLLNFVVFFLWGVLLIAPLESAISVTSRQMLSDTEHDFMSTWKAAGVSSKDIILGRFLASMTVYLAGMLCLFSTLCVWLVAYFGLVDWVSPYLANFNYETIAMSEAVYLLTDGLKHIVSDISLANMLLCITTAILLAASLIMVRLRLSVYFSNMEQVRTKFVPINVLITNLPILGFVLGAFGFTLWWVPGLNVLTVFQHLFMEGVPTTFLMNCWATLLVIIVAFFLSASSRVADQKRLMLAH